MNDEAKDLNRKFLSSDFRDLNSFYEHFERREDLIRWMKNRHKNEPKIIDVDGEEKVVIVIPTADFESQKTQTCKDIIFKGIHQIYVESVKPRDLFFNYSHNVNLGVTHALKLKPEWIVISNDDMLFEDPPKKLLSELDKVDPDFNDAVFTKPPGSYHSFLRFIGEPTIIYSMIVTLHPNRSRHFRLKLWNKFELRYVDALYSGPTGFLSKLTYKTIKPHLLTGSFTVLSRKYAESQKSVFDETFINGGEDTDLSLRIFEDQNRIGFIDYRIGDSIGSSLGSGWSRSIRNVVNEVYLSYKIERGLLKL